MSLNDNILNTALLGTATRELQETALPEELKETFRDIKERAEDAEAAFYQQVALGFAWSRAGVEPQQADDYIAIKEAGADETGYFTREAGELLLLLIAERYRYLLLYAYRRAATCGKLILPNYLQALLSHAFERNNPSRNEEQQYLPSLTGNRGCWLLPLMGLPVWGTKNGITWETASHEERKRLLLETRRENPDSGLALLQTELKNDSAAHRDELIQCLQEKLNGNDESFLLEVIATDRSSTVKDTARRLLCSLPNSEQVRYYQDLLKGKLHYNRLLGWSYDKLDYTDEMKKRGLAEVSSVKNEKDDRFLLRQLAERVPLSFWCEFYDCEPEQAATKLAKNPPFKDLFDLWKPVSLFRDADWAYYTLKERTDEVTLVNLMGLLPPVRREEITLRPEGKDLYVPDDWYNTDGGQWGMKFSMYVFHRMLTRTYYIAKEEVEQTAVYFPSGMLSVVQQKLTTMNATESTAARICRLLADYLLLKQQIETLFEDKK